MSEQFEQKSPTNKELEPKPWGGVTDPKEHDPKKFRYLVHAFNPFAQAFQQLATVSAKLSGAYRVDTRQGYQTTNLFDQPERLGERISLSMSLIDQDHTATWGEGGIIVEAPEENIVITSPTDVGSHNSSREFLRTQAQTRLKLSGDELLQGTAPGSYNEVVALAKSESGKTVRLKGFFIKVNRRGQPTDPVIAEKLREHAKRLNLPLVEIRVHGLYEQEKLEITENGIWAHFKGNRYNLGSKDPDFAFMVNDDTRNSFFPSPQEIEEVITHFMKCGDIDEALAQQIREGYKIADARRKSPKVKYNPETNEILKVTIKDGYGKDEVEYWLYSSGYCWKANMEEYIRAVREMMLNPKGADLDAFKTPISSSQFLVILKSRRKTMDPKEYKKLVGFVKGMRDKIDQLYNQE